MQSTATLSKISDRKFQTTNVRVFPRGAFVIRGKKHHNTLFKKQLYLTPFFVDIDGNGIIDAEISPSDNGMVSDPLAYISLMKKTIISFSIQKQTEKQLLNDMEQIERTLERFIKFDDIAKKIFEKFSQRIRNEKIRDKWKEWRTKHLARRDKIEDKLLLTLIENTEKDVTRFRKQKKVSVDQADILFTMLGELKTLVK